MISTPDPFVLDLSKGEQRAFRRRLSYVRSYRLRREQNVYQLVEGRFGFLIHFFDLDRADGMLNGQHRMVRRTERIFLRFRQSIEGLCDHRNRKPAAFLNLD